VSIGVDYWIASATSLSMVAPKAFEMDERQQRPAVAAGCCFVCDWERVRVTDGAAARRNTET
jgi:hypothetical protein